MSVVVLVARSSDGFLLSSSDKTLGTETLKHCKSLFHNHALLQKQMSLEAADLVYHFQKGTLITILLISPLEYSVMEAFTRISRTEQSYVDFVGEEKIQTASTFIHSANELLAKVIELPFDKASIISYGELPSRRNISVVLEKIKGQPFGFSSNVLKKKKSITLEWREIGLLVPLTLMGFLKSIIAVHIGGVLSIGTNFISTAISFYLVFICVHDLLTTSRLILSSFLLLILTYGTTMTSLISVVFNGIFALLTLGNVAYYYLKPVGRTAKV